MYSEWYERILVNIHSRRQNRKWWCFQFPMKLNILSMTETINVSRIEVRLLFWASTPSLALYLSSEWPPFASGLYKQGSGGNSILITSGGPANRIRLSTPFKTHWQLWHVIHQHKIQKAETRSDWLIQHTHKETKASGSHHNTTDRHGVNVVLFLHIQLRSQRHCSYSLVHQGRAVPLSKWTLESICWIQCPPHLS